VHVLVAAWLTVLLAVVPGLAASAAGPAIKAGVATASRWQWPLRPGPDQVVHSFDAPEDRWDAGHRGVDLLGTFGESVRAAGTGLVAYAGLLAGRGVVTITHGALRTTYEPVTPTVHVGDRVRAGGVIATLDLLGGHCLPRACLHWGLLRGSTYLDPLSLVGAGPVRLLPLTGVPAASSLSSSWGTRSPEGSATTAAAGSGEVAGRPRGSPVRSEAARLGIVVAGLGLGGVLVARRRSRMRE
jgi:murein DD-endopeptidase MepM/ murein hydrolase activator NlpD